VHIRPLSDYSELLQAVDFQRLIWGQNFSDTVPASVLWVALRTGGLVVGAFDEANQMIGFLFGITGFADGQPSHWSDMLAVHQRARGRGIGRALKQFQRDTLLRRGVQHVGWTFDPLESRNAHLNFARLGITSREYIPNCYGDSNSPLHAGLATDRLVASWSLASARVRLRMEDAEPGPGRDAVAALPLINEGERLELELTAPRLRVRVPADIQTLKQVDRSSAVALRMATRAVFTAYFGRGYTAVEFVRETRDVGCYILEGKEIGV
jgi:chorismate synthase